MPGKTKKSAGPSSAGEDVVMQDAAASEIESHALQSLEEGDLEVVTLDEVDDRITIVSERCIIPILLASPANL